VTFPFPTTITSLVGVDETLPATPHSPTPNTQRFSTFSAAPYLFRELMVKFQNSLDTPNALES
jgi:hypothetical protein